MPPVDTTTPLQEVPELLKGMKNWVTWKHEATKDGGVTKVPKIPGTNCNASSTDPSTWRNFQTALNSTAISSTCGIGFMIGGEAIDKKIVGFDLDNCRHPETGTLTAWAEEIVDHLDSYTEVTPSGTGLRVLVIGEWGKESGFNLNPGAGAGGE